MHVDTGHNFPEVLAFRDRRVKELGVQLVVASVQEAIDNGTVVEPPDGTRNRIQTPVLLSAWRSTASAPSSAAPAATRTRPGPRSGSSRSATTSDSGTPRTSGQSLAPLQRAHPPRREHPRLPALELDRARHLALHRPGEGRTSVHLLRARPRGRGARRDALRGQRVLPGPPGGWSRPSRSATGPWATRASLPPSCRTRTRWTRSSTRSPPPGSPSGAPLVATTSSAKPQWKTESARGISKHGHSQVRHRRVRRRRQEHADRSAPLRHEDRLR